MFLKKWTSSIGNKLKKICLFRFYSMSLLKRVIDFTGFYCQKKLINEKFQFSFQDNSKDNEDN